MNDVPKYLSYSVMGIFGSLALIAITTKICDTVIESKTIEYEEQVML